MPKLDESALHAVDDNYGFTTDKAAATLNPISNQFDGQAVEKPTIMTD